MVLSFLIGYFFGGVVVLWVVGEFVSVKVVVMFGVFFDLVYVMYNFGGVLDEIVEKGEVQVSFGGCFFKICESFV